MGLDTSWDLDNAMVLLCHLGTCHRAFVKELMERNVLVVLGSNDAPGTQNHSLGQELSERVYNPAIMALASLEIVHALAHAVDLSPTESCPYLLHQHPLVLACDTLHSYFQNFKLSHISDICE